MSDIFLSYARSTEAQAHVVAEALRALGYRVWRDDELPAHRAYRDVLKERLAAAKAVVVVWSAAAMATLVAVHLEGQVVNRRVQQQQRTACAAVVVDAALCATSPVGPVVVTCRRHSNANVGEC